MSVTHIVGARPNFMKAAPVMQALAAAGISQSLVHTGQHYDEAMSGRLFAQLRLPVPDVNLNVGSGSHAQQTAAVMVGVETELIQRRPRLLVVYGDVNSTVAAALAAAKLQVPVAHVEAGLRSFDRTMPEEINRLVTDRLSTLLFTPSADGDENLLREGTPPASIHRVGNVMVDSLVKCLPMADASGVLAGLGLTPTSPYLLVTLHRPSSVDDPELLEGLLETLRVLAARLPVVFPVHPRTKSRLEAKAVAGIHLIDPVGYLEFLALQRDARLVITDSGGVQEETTYLKVPCLTVRDNTERPVTITNGTNTLIGRNPKLLLETANARLDEPKRNGAVPELWDGHASDRIAAVITDWLN
jgi:UDP-N-acetylglucosamine 2-epimerase (non-hydrolysing)